MLKVIISSAEHIAVETNSHFISIAQLRLSLPVCLPLDYMVQLAGANHPVGYNNETMCCLGTVL